MKVLLLPNNIASLMSTLVGELRKKNVEAVGFNFAPRIFQAKENVENLPDSFFAKTIFVIRFLYHLITADAVHWIYGSKSTGSKPLLFLVAILKKKKFVEFCGSDVRSLEKLCHDVPDYQFEKFTDSQKFFLGTKDTSYDTQRRFHFFGFVPMPNSPELVDYMIPEVNPQYFPISRSVDLSKLKPSPRPVNELPVVVHVPSNAKIKGTDEVVATAIKLANAGKIRFELIQNVSTEKAKEMMDKADIVIDQLLIGEYGLISIEAMALERSVICFLRPTLDKHYKSLSPECPIVNADGKTLESAILQLAGNPKLREELGKKGRTYVETFHNSEKNADQILRIYSGEMRPHHTVR